MAKMIPETCPPDTASKAERDLFAALKERLSDAYTVIHSLPWLRDEARGLREGECDFLVFHPRNGLLAIEAKTGLVAFENGRGIEEKPGGRPGSPDKDPFRQAENSIHTIVKDHVAPALGLVGTIPIPFGHAVALPDVQKLSGKLAIHMRPELLLVAMDLKTLQSRIEAILKRYGNPPREGLSAEQARKAMDAILPVFRVIRCLGSQLQQQEEGLVRLTNSQWAVLESMAEYPRLKIDGCAGSGKTLLACRKALGERLTEEMRPHAARVEATRFHSLCMRAAQTAKLDFTVPKEEGDVSQFWEETAPQLLQQALEKLNPDRWRFDALIVDEGQDFATSWWKPLLSLLRDPKEGVVYIFFDPQQDLYGRQQDIPIPGPPVRLRFNCRNTQRIAEVVQKLGKVKAKPAPECVEGDPVTEHTCDSDEAERATVARVIEHPLDRLRAAGYGSCRRDKRIGGSPSWLIPFDSGSVSPP